MEKIKLTMAYTDLGQHEKPQYAAQHWNISSVEPTKPHHFNHERVTLRGGNLKTSSLHSVGISSCSLVMLELQALANDWSLRWSGYSLKRLFIKTAIHQIPIWVAVHRTYIQVAHSPNSNVSVPWIANRWNGYFSNWHWLILHSVGIPKL